MHENIENTQNAENAENAESKTQENSERGNNRISPVFQTESQEEKVERLSQTVEGLLGMFQDIMPLVTKSDRPADAVHLKKRDTLAISTLL